MTRHFLAFDLGAESGRAMLGRLRSGVLDLTEMHRFLNEPIHDAGSLRWNAGQIWTDIRRGLESASDIRLESVGIDAWGVDYALLDERSNLFEKNPYHYRDPNRRDGDCAAADRHAKVRGANTDTQLDRRRRGISHEPCLCEVVCCGLRGGDASDGDVHGPAACCRRVAVQGARSDRFR